MLTKKIDQNNFSSYQKQKSKMPMSWWVASCFLFYGKKNKMNTRFLQNQVVARKLNGVQKSSRLICVATIVLRQFSLGFSVVVAVIALGVVS